MRAKEFITEAAREFSHRKSSTMVKTYAFPKMPSNNPYRSYRFGIAMANHKLKHDAGPADEFAVISAYTSAEDDIINQAAKMMGEPKIVIADGGSSEPNDTGKQSPVAALKKNKYGV